MAPGSVLNITSGLAEHIWNILADEVGGWSMDETMFHQFLHHVVRDKYRSSMTEFRFQGQLGFGGKFHADQWNRHWVVSCYRENETPDRLEMIQRANALLAELEARVTQEQFEQ